MSDFVYRIREAVNPKERPPAIFLLHGYGSHADDLFSFAPYLPDSHTIIALQAPLSLPFGGFAWYSINIDVTSGKWSDDDEARKAIEFLLATIPNLCQKHHLDTQDITLFGFSQGAILSWAIALDHPHLVRRVVALSGYVNWDIVATSMETIQEVPTIYATHGTEDAIIPIDWARNSIVPLTQKNNTIVFHEFPDAHTVSQENFTKLLEWIESTNQ